MTERTYDVIVVGARIAGASTAMLLAQRGLDVLLLDRTARGSDTASTHALMRPAVELLDQWGLLDEIIDASTPAIRNVVFNYEGRTELFDLSARPLYAPRRTLVDRILADAATSAGADVRFDSRVLDVRRSVTGRVNGVVLDSANGPRFVGASLVIGADGIGSRVARSVGAPMSNISQHSSASAYAYFDDVDADGYRWFFSRHAHAGVIPTNDGLSCVFASVSTQRFKNEIRNDVRSGFWRALAEAAPELMSDSNLGRQATPLRSFPGSTGFTRRAAGPGWALVGDAGAFTDPMSSHGMTAAFRDAVFCAEAAASALEDPRHSRDAWREFEHLRDSFTVPFIRAVDDVAAFEYGMDRVQAAHVAMSKVTTRESEELDVWATNPARPAGTQEVDRFRPRGAVLAEV